MAYYGPMSRIYEVIQSPDAVAVMDQFVPGLCGFVTLENPISQYAVQRIFAAFPLDAQKAFYFALGNVQVPSEK